MIEEEKDGFVFPDFSPNQNPFVNGTKEHMRNSKPTDYKISNDIFDDDDGGDYTFLYWNQ